LHSRVEELEDQVEQYEKERQKARKDLARLEAKIESQSADYKQVEVNLL